MQKENVKNELDSDVVIKVEGLHKKFCRNLRRSMFYGCLDVTRDMFGISRDRGKLRRDEFFALENVSFEVKKGEAFGIIGQNGSGKTTLLRIINGIFPPDRGKISVRGRIGALIAVGAGFHPHMTGRENIYLNGTILGMTKKEINDKFREIIDFADIGEFIDAPVSTYSSGMTVRLGFAIAIHSNSEILLADEVLAVGDLNFALKCYRKIAEYRGKGGAIILISHNMHMIRHLCQKVVWIQNGKMINTGDVLEMCNKYEEVSLNKDYEENNISENAKILNFDDSFKISSVDFLDSKDSKTNKFISGEPLKIRINFQSKRSINNPIFSISLLDSEGNIIFESYSKIGEIGSLLSEGTVEFLTEKLSIRPNIYDCSISLAEGELLNKIEWHERAYKVVFDNKNNLEINQGIIFPYPQWILKNKIK